MTTRRAGAVLRHLSRAESPTHSTGETDGELLERFVRHRDEAAIETLVRRHAPMVWGVCRRILRNHHDAEDALQATFLVLVRRASAVTPRETVAGWLHGVARQTALKARQMAALRNERERQVAAPPEPTAPEAALWSGLEPLLDRELAALPEKYRVLLVLCDLEERTRREVAAQLGLPEGTVAGRLARARALLAARLTRRGLPLSAALVPGVLASEASAAVPRAAVAAAVHLTTCCGRGAGTGPAVLMAEGVLRAMFVTKLKVAAVVLLALATICGAVWVPLSVSGAAEHPTSDRTDVAPPGGSEIPAAAEPAGDDRAAERLWSEVGVKVERVRASAVCRAKADLGGGLKVLAVRPGSPAEKARIEEDDVIVGLHLWETLSVDACLFILDQCRDDEVTAPKCSLVRNGRMTSVYLSLPPERRTGTKADGKERAPDPDLAALEGVWELVSEEHNGEKKPLVFTSYQITFKGASVSTEWVRDDVNGGVVTRSEGKSPAGCTFTIDSSKNPRELTITGENLKIQAIYTLEKDRLTIAHFGKPEDARPRGFKPGKGDDNVLVVRVLEREKKKQHPAPPNAPGGGGPPPAGPKGGGAGTAPPPRTDKELLQGTWVIVSYEVDGKVDPAAQKQSLHLSIEGDRFTLRPELALHFPYGTFTLDTAKKPRTIDFTQIYGFPQEKPVLVSGIYELDGETLKICRATSGDKRPTDFTTKAGSGRELLVFRRPVADGAKKPDSAPPAAPPVSGLGFPSGGGPPSAPKLRDDDPDLKRLQGKWVLTKTEAQGKAQPAGENPFVQVIDGRKATLLKGEEVIWEGEFLLVDSTSKPARYDFKITSKRRLTDSPQYGIYELSGDELKTRSSASAVTFDPDTAAVVRPKSFDTTGSSNATFFWNRQK